jgi:type VI secretion system secreted protein VgrG
VPYALPDDKTQSGFLSRSSKEGGSANFNELRFEDLTGEELVYLHAEKDFETVVENDETIHIGNDRTKTVDVDETNEVSNNRTENVDNNEDITIGGNRTEMVTGNEDLTVSSNRTEAISGSEQRTVGGNVTENIGANASQTVGGSYTQTVAGGITITTPASVTINATAGVTMMGPAGIKKVDNFFGEYRALATDAFNAKLSICMMSFDEIGVQMGASSTKAEATANKGEIVTQKIANKPAQMGSGAADVGHGAFHIIGAALLAIL